MSRAVSTDVDLEGEDTERVSPTSPRERVRYECPDCGRTLRATDRTECVIAHEEAAR